MTNKDLILDNAFGKDLLSKLGDLDADSPLRKVDMSESSLKFLPKFSVNMKNNFVLKTKDGNIEIKEEKLPCVVHHFHPDMHRIFYKNPFDPKNPAPPDCGSNDGISPDPSCTDPQSTRCDTCKHKAERTCKLKQRIIVSQKAQGGEPQLMTMDLNVTSVLNTDGEIDGYFGFKKYTQMVAKVQKNIYQFVTELYVDPDDRCKVQFKAIDAISDDNDPNLVAHRKVKEHMDFDELCKVDFAPWGAKDDESQVDVPAPETKLSPKPEEKKTEDDGGGPDVKASDADVKDWLNKKK